MIMKSLYNRMLSGNLGDDIMPFAPKKMNIGPLAIPLIQAAGTLLGSLINNTGSIINNNRMMHHQWDTMLHQEQWQEEMMYKQNDINVANWNMENEYNTPVAQLERLREAGVNPNNLLGALGQGKSGNVQGSSVPSAPSGATVPQEWFPIDLGVDEAIQAGLADAQRKNIEADTENKEADTKNKQLTHEEIQANIENAKKYGGLLDQEVKNKELVNEYQEWYNTVWLPRQEKMNDQEYLNLKQQWEQGEKQLKQQDEVIANLREEREKIKAEKAQALANAKAAIAQAGVLDQQKLESQERIISMKYDRALKDAETRLKHAESRRQEIENGMVEMLGYDPSKTPAANQAVFMIHKFGSNLLGSDYSIPTPGNVAVGAAKTGLSVMRKVGHSVSQRGSWLYNITGGDDVEGSGYNP